MSRRNKGQCEVLVFMSKKTLKNICLIELKERTLPTDF